MELNTISLSDFVKLADVIWFKGADSLNQAARSSGLFKEESIPQNTGNTREYSEIDLQEYARVKGQSAQAARARVQQGYSKTLTSYRVALDIGVSYEQRTQNKYQEVMDMLTNLAPTAYNRMDLDLTHRITFATSTSYTDMDGRTVDVTVGDGLALASTVHTLKGSSTTYRNRLANNPRVSKGALEGMERLKVEETYNHLGEKKVMDFDILWSTDDPNTVNTIREYLRSTGNPDGAHAGIVNVYNGKYRHVILPRIATDANGAVDSTKRYYWGIAASRYSTAHLAMFEEPHMKKPANLNAAEEFSTDDWNFGVRGGWGICIVSANWFKISTGDGNP